MFVFRGAGVNFWLGARFTPMKDVIVYVDVPNQLDLAKSGASMEKFGVFLEKTVHDLLVEPLPISWTLAAGLSLLWN